MTETLFVLLKSLHLVITIGIAYYTILVYNEVIKYYI